MEIEKLVYGGEGLARNEGRVILVPFVLPGEQVRITEPTARKGVARAEVEAIETPSPLRVAPGCEYFGACGGCQYQHTGYEHQLELKRGILAEVLRRVGKIEPPETIGTISGEPWGYRNRIQLHMSGGRLGFVEAGSHRLCPVTHCPISSPKLNQAIAVLSEMMRDRRWPNFLHSLELFTNEHEVQLNVTGAGRPVGRRFFEWCEERLPGVSQPAIDYESAGFRYRVGGKSFFQVNRFLIEALVNAALDGETGDRAVDLYAGVGLFSLPLASRFVSLRAVEGSGTAARDLRFNLERAALGAETPAEPVETFLDRLEQAPDFVLADPPRTGLGKRVVRRLCELRPPRLTIVACDPSTLARDLGALLASGYALEALTLVDLFPQTMHIEAVAQLRLR